MRLKPTDLIVTIVIAILNVLLALLPIQVSVLKIVLALPLLFVLPGYTLSEVMFRKRLPNGFERLLFSLGLSLGIDILGGLFLNLLPTGLQATSWAILLGLLTLAFSLLALYLRRGIPMDSLPPLRIHLAIYPSILFALAIVVTIVSLLHATNGASRQPYPGFTQMWILPEVSNGKSCAVRIGIKSFESTSVTYRLAVIATDGSIVETWSSLSLVPQEEWVRPISVPSSASNDVSIDARLYQTQSPEKVYREVHVTLPNVKKGKDGEIQQCGMHT